MARNYQGFAFTIKHYKRCIYTPNTVSIFLFLCNLNLIFILMSIACVNVIKKKEREREMKAYKEFSDLVIRVFGTSKAL